MSNDKPKVLFVGAGCGAADLITVRGMRALECADVVVYAGSLVNPELLSYCPNAELFNSARMTLEEIVDAIASRVKLGKRVVRLHSGEPSLYGAIREQMDELDRLGIEYEVCPGVTACFGAAAALDLEYTLPNISQSLIITRMAGKTAVPETESIESFAAHHASMAVYLSSGMLGKLAEKLTSGGYEPTTPCALVYRATWPDEKIVLCTIATLEASANANGISKTAVVLVGDALAKSGYAKSRLYAADFSTEFRKAKE